MASSIGLLGLGLKFKSGLAWIGFEVNSVFFSKGVVKGLEVDRAANGDALSTGLD